MKKIISVFLVLVLGVMVFSACSKGEEKSETVEEATVKLTVDTHYADYNESAVNAYEKICNAVINGQEEVKFNTVLIDEVNQLYYTCFPLYSLVESIELLPDNSGYSIKYKNSTQEHLALVEEFNNKVVSIMNECQYGKVSVDNYIFNVYTYITKNFTSDDTVLTAYDAIMQNKGYSSAINSLFEYLVLQGGGKACHVMGDVGASIISLVEFKGVWYYFDPYSEIKDNQGTALKYFAMSDNALNTVYSYTDGESVEEKGDGAFDKLQNSTSFEFDGKKAIVKCSDGEDFEIDLG